MSLMIEEDLKCVYHIVFTVGHVLHAGFVARTDPEDCERLTFPIDECLFQGRTSKCPQDWS